MKYAKYYKPIIQGLDDYYNSIQLTIPTVIESIEPRIRIYDANEKDTYWYRKIGFNRRITDED